MAKKVYDIVVTQEYESRGEKKKRYINIGCVFEGDKGMSIKIETVPIGWNGWASLYVPKERDAEPVRSVNQELESDLPF